MIMPDGAAYENWQHKNGIQTCDLLTMPDGRAFKNWEQKNGIVTFEPVKRKADTKLSSRSKRKKS